MTSTFPVRMGLLLLLVSGVGAISAMARSEADDVGPSEAETHLSLEGLTQRAGIIFAGRVLKIEFPGETWPQQDSENDSLVRITFQVDDGIRGAKSGDIIAIREWVGLWNGNATGHVGAAHQRYRVGEKVLVFYHRPNPSGITSPVGGAAGRFPITGRDLIRLTPERKQALLRSKRLSEIEPALDANSTSPGQSSSLPYSKLARALRLVIQEQSATE